MGVSGLRDQTLVKLHNFRNAFRSRENFGRWIRTSEAAEDSKGHTWYNEDLAVTPKHKRTWAWWNYVTFYLGLAFGNWTLGSTMVGIGLNWWQSIIVIFVSQFISSVAMYFNSRCASAYHIGYPVVARSVFGMYGSYYFVGARAALAIIWYGVQLYSGASFMDNILRAIFGHHFTDIPNHIPASIGITSQGMLAFFLFWLVHFPFCAFRPYQLRVFFWFKAIIVLPAVFGLFIFCMVNTKANVGSVYKSTITGSSAGWFWMFAINSGMGNTATLITNQPDIARWSRTRKAAQLSQLIVQPISVTLSAAFGILATAAINNTWGLSLWNPWDLLSAILDRYWSSSTRFAVFLAAFCWMVSILGTNIAANMIPFGSDSTLLFPRYLNIPRGQYLVEFLAFAICPWKILASASVFTTFLAGYGIFMASVAAIMICDYYLLTKGNVFPRYLYNGSSSNEHYYYAKGWNIQAVIAYLCGIALPFPGFVGTLGAHVSESATELGRLGWLLSFTISFVVYYILCLIWPTQNQKLVREKALGWEEQADMEDAREAEGISGSGGEEGIDEAETFQQKY
ncbi:uracil permease-like protein [Xylogone sp. PMI_703]|nr:uracil permease-like protein [Xylogone sp. PMI_703]